MEAARRTMVMREIFVGRIFLAQPNGEELLFQTTLGLGQGLGEHGLKSHPALLAVL